MLSVLFPICSCPAGPVLDYRLKEFSNKPLSVYAVCRCCGTRARSPVKRESIPLTKWRELLIENGREVVAL